MITGNTMIEINILYLLFAFSTHFSVNFCHVILDICFPISALTIWKYQIALTQELSISFCGIIGRHCLQDCAKNIQFSQEQAIITLGLHYLSYCTFFHFFPLLIFKKKYVYSVLDSIC